MIKTVEVENERVKVMTICQSLEQIKICTIKQIYES